MVKRIVAKNFCSYQELDLDLTNKGLVLIHGPTGAGKSTLCDVVSWTLYGKTAKGGAVDEVLSWPGSAITEATAHLDDDTLVYRARGPKPKDNDLWIDKQGKGVKTRGKDLNDTQKIIDALTSVSEVFVGASYYNEFVNSTRLFTASSSDRKLFWETLSDLALPSRLNVRSQDLLKTKGREQKDLEARLLMVQTELETTKRYAEATRAKVKRQIAEFQEKHINFDISKASTIEQLEGQLKTQEQALLPIDPAIEKALKSRLNALNTERCDHCGSLVASDEKATITAALTKLQRDKAVQDTAQSRITELRARIQKAQAEKNPYPGIIANLQEEVTSDIVDIKGLEQAVDSLVLELIQLKSDIADLELLQQAVAELRSALVKSTMNRMQDKTNDLLSRYFDAEIRVSFTLKAADKIETEIYKDGNLCVFSQLSKGQRQLLKLCFGITSMQETANQHRLDIRHLFFDEAFDGMDEALKIKAYRLLTELASTYESVFVVEHSSELKAMFPNKIEVALENGHSVLYED